MARESTTRIAPALAPRRPMRYERRHGSAVVVKSYPQTQDAAVAAAMTGLWASRLTTHVVAERDAEWLGFDARAAELSWPGCRILHR